MEEKGPQYRGYRNESEVRPRLDDSTISRQHQTSEQSRQLDSPYEQIHRSPTRTSERYSFPEAGSNLDEVAAPSPIYDPSEDNIRRHEYLEDVRSDTSRRRSPSSVHLRFERKHSHGAGVEAEASQQHEIETPSSGEREKIAEERQASQFWTKLYTVSYLIFFSFAGTILRLVIEALTFYPGTPVITSVLWANVGGSFVMGFLSEDRRLFSIDGIKDSPTISEAEDEDLVKAHHVHKKTIPLYIGLATGFCGSLTSFSTFIRDAFVAISNDIPAPHGPYSKVSIYQLPPSNLSAPNGGYSFMAVVAVLITEIGLSLAGLMAGAHFALLTAHCLPPVSTKFMRQFLDPLIILIAPLTWVLVICLVVLLPHYQSDNSLWNAEIWRGPALFSLVFSPAGCLLRFYVSLKLNSRIPSFPLGTFVVNVGGTMILGMAYSLQHAQIGSSLGGGSFTGCQVLQGIMDGFCGCVTTVSTWVLELSNSRRRHAYIYGVASVAVALAMLVVEIGSLRWTRGFTTPACFA
ncbi:hypothetical protein BC1G_09568 [Paecilomyces variotii No. 5]|uniref:CrcB-like protein-domain-containing protein n=1 Tax=Byssochlamys spectabilis (strain No. 5 / NBRC 109023) TaxID=1356009 RepID=V5FBU9_BYSSN|nr:hypothetical protein BC1G_09568 [Paecilomyces variotii No. 5]